MTSLRWWRRFLVENKVNKGLGWVTLVHLGIMTLNWFYPSIISLLIIFTLATAVCLYDIWRYFLLFRKFVGKPYWPSSILVGHIYVPILLFILGAALALPAYANLDQTVHAQTNPYTYLLAFSYAYNAWTFFLVARYSEKGNDEPD